MTEGVFEYLRQVDWLEARNQIPRWHDRGIHHGFEGLGHELPPYGLHLKQVHSRHVVEITESGSEGIAGQGDALATFLPTHRIAVKTADCVPILLYHHEFVMAIHAGWRGLAQDILGEACRFVAGKGLELKDCEWGIGPSILPASFEVGPEVIEVFANQEAFRDELSWNLTKGLRDRWHLDLQAMAVLRLRRAGVLPTHISVIRSDTKTHSDKWHSFRRSGDHAGRNWSWIEHGSAALTSLGLT
ncbi:MAG: polyphenol oxidase family protein [Chitinophagaceae bacterium]|nr:polyphenol oxidase family protein [Oligoflexus sp.]